MAINNNEVRVTFDKIIVGRKFKTAADITYKKVSKVSAVAIKNSEGEAIRDGKKTSLFYNSNVLVFETV